MENQCLQKAGASFLSSFPLDGTPYEANGDGVGVGQAKPDNDAAKAAGDNGQAGADRSREFSAQAIHLVRTSQINTLTLSQMADQKASILIGATFVVFSLAVTRLLGQELSWSTLALAATAFLSSLCAVMAVVPSLGKPPKDPLAFNPLFFGHFASLETDEWTDQLIEKFETDEAVFRTMLKDIHQNGQVLYRRKYRFLGYAYRTFLGGLAITMAIYTFETFAA